MAAVNVVVDAQGRAWSFSYVRGAPQCLPFAVQWYWRWQHRGQQCARLSVVAFKDGGGPYVFMGVAATVGLLGRGFLHFPAVAFLGVDISSLLAECYCEYAWHAYDRAPWCVASTMKSPPLVSWYAPDVWTSRCFLNMFD